jgi:hypothetical protein
MKRPHLCLTPGKNRYSDEIDAKVHLAFIQRYGERREKMPVRVYRCECGAWHLTSKER